MSQFLGRHELELWSMAVAACCALPCALLGCYLVLRKLSLLGDAISHSVLPGIALAFLLTGRISGWPLVLGAAFFGVLTAFLIELLSKSAGVSEDSSTGLVFTALFALGVLLITRLASSVDLDPGCVLYGLIELTPFDVQPLGRWLVPRALFTLVPVLIVTTLFILLLWKELKITSFDPALATAMGINATLMHYLLTALVAGVTVAAFEAVGSILVIAMLIVPAATAHLLADRLSWMMGWSAVMAGLSAVAGTWLAFRIDTSVAGMMAVVAGTQLALAVFLAPRHGILARAIRNLRLATRIACEDILATLWRAEEEHRQGRRATPAMEWPSALRRASGLARLLTPLALRRSGQVISGPGNTLLLTDRGRQFAQSLVRAHRLWEAYLEENLALPPDHLHDPAERMEHFLSAQLQEELAARLKQPDIDPHGREIPPAGS